MNIVFLGSGAGKGAQAERSPRCTVWCTYLPAKCYDLPFLQAVMWVQRQEKLLIEEN